MLAYFSSFHAALQHSFPEVTIEGQKFRMVPGIISISLPLFIFFIFFLFILLLILKIGRYWQSRQNLRQLLSDAAAKLGLDPLNAENWYSVKWEQVIHFPVRI